MKRLGRGISIFCVFALSFLGCDAPVPTTPGFYFSDINLRFSELKDNDCVVRVNGVKLTKRDFLARYQLTSFIAELQNGKMGVPVLDENELRGYWQTAMIDLIKRELFRQYAERMEIKPSAEAVAQQEAMLLKSFEKGTKLPFAKICAVAGDDVGMLLSRVPYEDARDQVSRQSVSTNDLSTVSDEELRARQRFVKAFDANANRLNGEQRKKLETVRQKIMAGADFAAVAAKCSEVSPEHGKEWQTVELGELPPDEDLAKWLKAAKVGDISEPLDLEDGLALVKLVATGIGDAPKGVERPITYTLVKCTVHAFEYMRHQNDEQMRAQLLLWKNQAAQKTLGTKLFAEAVIEYLNGTNFFPQVKTAE